MAECLNCGSENPEGTAFCMECGHPLVQPSKEESDNGQENSDGESTTEAQAISLDDKEKEPSTDAENIDGDTPKAEQVQDPRGLEDGDEALEHQGATIVAHETGRDGEPSESADAVIENEDNSDGEDDDGKDVDPDAALIEDGSNPDNETAEEHDADGGDVDHVGKDAKSENEPTALNETTNEDEAQKKESDVTLDGPDSPEDLDGVIEPEGCAETNGEAANVEDAEALSGDFADTADHPDPGTSPTGADDYDQTDNEEPDPEKHAAVDDPHDEGIVDVETDGAPSEELTSAPGDEATNEVEHQADRIPLVMESIADQGL